MENKKTTELLDLLVTLVDKDGNLEDGWLEALDELKTREPFGDILTSRLNTGESLQEKVERLEEEVKLLNRHRHDGTDVVVRL